MLKSARLNGTVKKVIEPSLVVLELVGLVVGEFFFQLLYVVVVVAAIIFVDGERFGLMAREKDPGGWIGKRVVELGSWIDRLGW